MHFLHEENSCRASIHPSAPLLLSHLLPFSLKGDSLCRLPVCLEAEADEGGCKLKLRMEGGISRRCVYFPERMVRGQFITGCLVDYFLFLKEGR